jgi:hypothetical protein
LRLTISFPLHLLIFLSDANLVCNRAQVAKITLSFLSTCFQKFLHFIPAHLGESQCQ